ncbi:MAG: hypothetical protein KDB22_26885 [Planctomycetales bacterium]|nr:hypothetical protein [Planctomycetales bacterium]
MMANKLQFDAKNLPSDAEINRMFDAVPHLDRFRVTDQVLRAGARPIVTRARQLAPRSTPEDRAKRSTKQKQAADWNYPLWKTIKYVLRKYSTSGVAVVGPEWPKGNKAYFNTSPSGRRQYLWGRATGRIVPQIRNWIVQAFDETKSQQLAEMKKKLRSVMDQIWRNRG